LNFEREEEDEENVSLNMNFGKVQRYERYNDKNDKKEKELLYTITTR